MIVARQLTKDFAGPEGTVIRALGPLDLQVAPGEFVCIVGPSGCGKSTLLRLIAGLEQPTAGTLSVGSQTPILVFQGDSTFPWLTVYGNVEYPLKLRGLSEKEREAAVTHKLGLVGLSRFAEAYPYQLSGGMKQRVALARAWVADPEILLMDEPFGALDEQTRMALQRELLRLWEGAPTSHDARKTVLFVTHSIDEALTLGDRVLVMSAAPGRIIKEVRVPFARPREAIQLKRDPSFGELTYELWQALA
ncbi:MAG: ABC transporter ATP-binding protein [Thermoflexales bacterium]|nr:ABC transporter ATP-binding protein [Thermoflexales bacterium]MDW8352801.1 ABC transporter ATP-binding protein [Anaerolineae bacterium]